RQDLVVNVLLLNVLQQISNASNVGSVGHIGRIAIISQGRGVGAEVGAGREGAVATVVVMRRNAKLLETVLAVGASRSIAHLLHGRQQKTDQDGDDCNHHQQVDQREAHLLTSKTNHDSLLKKTPRKRGNHSVLRRENQTFGWVYLLSRAPANVGEACENTWKR